MFRVAIKPDVFSAISDPTRRTLLLRLAREGGKNVSDLLRPLSISQPAVSKHLRCLRQAGLVRSQTVGRERIYDINPYGLRQVYDWVSQFEQYWDEKLDALGSYLAKRKK